MLDPKLFFTQNFKQGTPNTIEVKRMFHSLVGRYDPKNILEIGFLNGHSAVWFLEMFPNAKLTSVDNVIRGTDNAYEPIFRQVFLKYYPRFTFHYGDSSIIRDHYPQPGHFDFAFIDGDHTFEGALKDLDMCIDLKIPTVLLDNANPRKNRYTKQIYDGVNQAIAARKDKLQHVNTYVYYQKRYSHPEQPWDNEIKAKLYNVLYDDI